MYFKHAEFEVVVGCIQQTVARMGLAALGEEMQDEKQDFIIIDINSGGSCHNNKG